MAGRCRWMAGSDWDSRSVARSRSRSNATSLARPRMPATSPCRSSFCGSVEVRGIPARSSWRPSRPSRGGRQTSGWRHPSSIDSSVSSAGTRSGMSGRRRDPAPARKQSSPISPWRDGGVSDDRPGLGRAGDGQKPGARRPLPGGLRQSFSRVLAGRGADAGRPSARGAGPRVVRRVGNAAVRMEARRLVA